MAKKIKACTIQNDDFILYPRTAEQLIVDEQGVSLKDKMEAISTRIDDILNNNIDVDTTNFASKEQVNEIANKIDNILNGNNQQELLKLTIEDIGKVLSVAQNEKGELITKAVDMILNSDNISIEWEQIQNKPELASKLNIKQNELVLQSDVNDLSSVPLMEDEDIDNIIKEL